MKHNSQSPKLPIWLTWIIFFVTFLVTCLLVNSGKQPTYCLFQAATVGTMMTAFFWWSDTGKYSKSAGKYLLFIWLGLELLWGIQLSIDKGGLRALRPIHYWAPAIFNLVFVLVLYWMSKAARKSGS